ncbi:MAG: hypothetical protein ACK58T_17155, partial [Phycisphaerae bacterium]
MSRAFATAGAVDDGFAPASGDFAESVHPVDSINSSPASSHRDVSGKAAAPASGLFSRIDFVPELFILQISI